MLLLDSLVVMTATCLANLRLRSFCVVAIGIATLGGSCQSISDRHGADGVVPRYSIIHLEGRITKVPANSKWPHWVKVGLEYDYWAIIDNLVPDRHLGPRNGSFRQREAPSRYWMMLGGTRFDSQRFSNKGVFSVEITDEVSGNNPDGYHIGSSAQKWIAMPELPGLLISGVNVQIKNFRSDRITSDQLPIREFPLSERDEWILPPVIISATLDRIRSQAVYCDVETFEVFQVRSESELARFDLSK